jgi:hypothetical protein
MDVSARRRGVRTGSIVVLVITSIVAFVVIIAAAVIVVIAAIIVLVTAAYLDTAEVNAELGMSNGEAGSTGRRQRPWGRCRQEKHGERQT